MHGFLQKAQEARTKATDLLQDVWHTWERWEHGELDNRETCDRMCSILSRLRTLLENILDLMMESGGRSSEAFI